MLLGPRKKHLNGTLPFGCLSLLFSQDYEAHFEEDDYIMGTGIRDYQYQGVGHVENVEDRPKNEAASTGGAQAPPSFDVLKQAADEARKATQPAPTAETDTEPDSDAAPLGAGLKGQRAPLMVGSGLGRRVISDGAGLCSPGVWPPHDRPFPRHGRLQAVRSAILRALATLNGQSDWVRRTFDLLSQGGSRRTLSHRIRQPHSCATSSGSMMTSLKCRRGRAEGTSHNKYVCVSSNACYATPKTPTGGE